MASKEFDFLALCASYIERIERLKYLQCMLASWAAQTQPISLLLHVGCVDKLYPLLQKLIADWGVQYPRLKIMLDAAPNTQLSQFERYAHLVAAHKQVISPDTWLLFTDDDDIWHSHRCEGYAFYIQTAMASPLAPKVVSVQSLVHTEGEIDLRTHKEVTDALAQNKISLDSSGDRNYWMFVTQWHWLQQFVQEADPRLLRNVYCDMFFTKFIRYGNKGKTVQFTPQVEIHGQLTLIWMYYYRKWAGSICGALQEQLDLQTKEDFMWEGLLRNVQLYLSQADDFEIEQFNQWLKKSGLFKGGPAASQTLNKAQKALVVQYVKDHDYLLKSPRITQKF